MTTEDDPPALRFSTDDLPARDRLAIWREQIGRTVARLDLTPLDDGAFISEGVTRFLPGLAITSMSLAGIRSQRTRELISDGNDDIELILLGDGQAFASQLGRETVVDANSAILISNADESVITTPAAKGHSLRIPRQALMPLVGNLEDGFMRPIPRSSEAVRLLAGYVAAIDQIASLAAPELRHLIVTHVYDLVASAVGATREATEIAAGRGVRAARFAAIKADIANNIERQDMSAEWIAPRHGISPSSVRRMFEDDGVTFSQFVLDYRLALSYRLMCDPRALHRTISSIAFALGFGDLSYFNRTFRKRYGASPSDIREKLL